MNILILSGSPRRGGNTDLLVEAFVKGVLQKHHVEVVSVHDYKVNPCMGCNACFRSEHHLCAQKDDMSVIYEKMNQADMLVIASPVYFYGLSAQLKAVIEQYQLCLNFFKLEDAGRVLVRGVKDKGNIKNTNALNEAFELGQHI